MVITARIQWIGAEYGGRSNLPFVGMRPGIRMQRHIKEWLNSYNDVVISMLDINPTYWFGSAKIEISEDSIALINQIKIGELFEILDGYKVIAVGIIAEMNPSEMTQPTAEDKANQ